MKSKVWVLVMVALLLISSVFAVEEIDTCAELDSALTSNMGDDWLLIGDVDCVGYGLVTHSTSSYTGEFNGGNYTITGLRINATRAGLFHQMDEGYIHNLVIDDYVGYGAGSWTGGVVGYLLDGAGHIDQVAVKNAYINNTGTYTGAIVGNFEGGAGADITNCYAHNVTIIGGSYGAGLVSVTAYTGDVRTSFASNCSVTADTSGGVIASDDGGYGGGTYESFAYGNLVDDGITKQFAGSSLTQQSDNYFDGSNPLGGTDAVATEINQEGYFTNTTKGSYDPMDTWSTAIWILDEAGLPKFVWEAEAADTEPPTWDTNDTAGSPYNLGAEITSTVTFYDDDELNWVLFSYNKTGTWGNVSSKYVNLSGLGYDEYDFTAIWFLPKNPGNKTISWKAFSNDTSGNENATDIFSIGVVDRYPTKLSGGKNFSSPGYGGGLRMYDEWGDDGWLNNSGVTGYFVLYNTTGVVVNSTPAAYGTSNFNTGGWSSTYFRYDIYLDEAGTYTYKTCINDSDNKWACSTYTNFTIIGANPGWYGYGSNATSGQIFEGGDVVLFSNWTVSAGSLTNFSLREQYENGTWYNDNDTGWTPFSCGNYSDCAAEVTSVGSMEPIGNHTFVFVANSSADGFNQTPGFDIKVLRSMWLYEDTPTFLGSDLYREQAVGNMSVAPVESASRGITTLTLPPVMRDINGDGRDEVFFLDGNNLEIYNNTGLEIVSTTAFVGENFHRFVIVPNWTANFSVLALTEDEGNVILNDLRITGGGTSFTLNSTNITDWFTNYRGGELLMGCGNSSCVVAYTQYNYSFNTTNMTEALFALAFSKQLDSHTAPLLLQNNSVSGGICFSRWKNMEVKDIDGDGTEEAVFATIGINNGGSNDESVAVWYLQSGGGSLEKYHRENISMGNAVIFSGGDGTLKCYDDGSDHTYTGVNRFLSNILVFNSGVNASTLETHIATTKNDYDEDGDWRINIISVDWSSQSVDYSGDQGIMSNLVRAANHSVCGWGFESPDRLMCGSNASDLTPENWKVVGADYTYTYGWADTLYATNFIPDSPDFVIRNGLWYYDGSDLVRDVEWNYTFAVPVPIVSESGVDLIITTSTTMYYFDDGYLELPAELTWWKVNPCIYNIDGYETWWENTTIVYVWADVIDTDVFLKDNVSIRYILYNGTADEQVSIWTDGGAHTVQFQIHTSANYTTLGNATFIMQVNDTGNKTAVNYSFDYRVNRSVVMATVEYGDCEWALGDKIYNSSHQEEEVINNSFIQGVKDAGAMAGFTGGLIKVFWLLIMAFIAFVLWWQVGADNPQLASGLIVGIELLMLFVGYYFELIPGAILFLVFFIGVVVGILFFKKRVMDS